MLMLTRSRSLIVRASAVALCCLLLGGCNTNQPASQGTPVFYMRLDQGSSLDEAAALSMINAWRARNGVGPLVLDPALSAQARARAGSVAETDTSTWGEVPTLTRASTGDGGARQERVSAGYRTLAEAFSGWRDSPVHNKVMLAPAGTRLGIAAVDRPGTKYRVYWDLIVAGPAG
jgi:uncharacterized protein YkwD